MRAATSICGINEPACLIGTNQPATATGAPSAETNHGSTSVGLTNCSASLVQAPLKTLSTKFFGTAVHCSSGMALHARSVASSPLRMA